MKSICIIPARSGSKGLPDKNMLFLAGKPMIFHTIEAIIDAGCFEKKNIYVSTDSLLYKEIIEKTGINVVLRKDSLADDYATTFDVMKDFLRAFDDDTVFMLCQATSPLRNSEDIKNAFDLYRKNKSSENVVSFSKVDKSPTLFTTLDKNSMAKDISGIDNGYRRQNEEELFYPNGAIFISKKSTYLKNASFFTEYTEAYVMSKSHSLDVDDKQDFFDAVGSLYFNYPQRELQNKKMYAEKYSNLKMKINSSNLILGDSRMENIYLPNYFNASLGGVTLKTLLDNIDLLVSKKIEQVFITLGVNDFISGYSLEELKNNFKKLIEELQKFDIKIVCSTIIYTIFRAEINNNKIKEYNEFLESHCNKNNIELLDLNSVLSKSYKLKFEYTYDGLHFNQKSNKKILDYLVSELVL